MLDSIISILEFISIGALAISALGYLAVMFRSVPKGFHAYFKRAFELIEPPNPSKITERLLVSLRFSIVIAGIWIFGIVANATAYWLLAPIQHEFINLVYKDKPIASRYDCLPLDLLRRISVNRTDSDYDAYSKYIKYDQEWRNLDLKSHDSIQPDLRKFLRIVRFAVVISLLVGIFAIWKTAIQLMIWLFRRFAKSLRFQNNAARALKSFADFWYLEVVSELEEEDSKWKSSLPKNALINLGIAIVMSCSFCFCTYAYQALETEYHLVVKSGAETARSEFLGSVKSKADSGKQETSQGK